MKKLGLTLVSCKKDSAKLTAIACSRRYTIANKPSDQLIQHYDNVQFGTAADIMVYGGCIGCKVGRRRAKLFTAEQLKRPGAPTSRGTHNRGSVHTRVRAEARKQGKDGEFTMTSLWRGLGSKDNKNTISHSIHRLQLSKEVRRVRVSNSRHYYVWIGGRA